MKGFLENAVPSAMQKVDYMYFLEAYENSESTWSTLRKKCPYSELFWSVFFRIRTRITWNTDSF